MVSVTLQKAQAGNEEVQDEKQDGTKISETVPSEQRSEEGDGEEQLDEKVADEQTGVKKEGRVLQNRDEVLEKVLSDKQIKITVDNSADNKIFEDTAEV